ncbi:MAG: hypothetical protein MUF84_16100 [Anaerolineae bacterium]|nr:hypothetical protein [Anaerolineae bacterium]
MTGDIAILIPWLRRVRWDGQWYALGRDEVYLLFIILNELLLGVETTLAHVSNGTLRPFEWVPILFGPLAGLGLIVAFVGRHKRWPSAALLTIALLTGSIVVGLLGTYLHLASTVRPFAASGDRVTLALVVWGLPPLAPPSFALVGALGLVSRAPLDQDLKGRLYFFLSSLGVAIATVSSVFDHVRSGFTNPWLWIPTVVGTFGVVAALVVGFLHQRRRADLVTFTIAMGAQLVVGPLGSLLHLYHDLGVGNTIVVERLLRNAPILAPMVFANMGLMGLLALLGDREDAQTP